MVKKQEKELKIEFVDVGRLILDDRNPRLSSIGRAKSQEELVQILWDEMAVSEVALSIAANGYFEEEPLFVIPENPKEKDDSRKKYIVVEGNRRLAAVKILRDKELRKFVKATDLPEISKKERDALDKLPVSIYPDKESLWEYFGFRHVNGPKEWDSFSKASYIAMVRRTYGIPLEEIARKIGDKHKTVERIYRGFILLEQAEAKAGFDRNDRIANRFYFSHLYTAADQKEFQDFLGIDPAKTLSDNPVPKNRMPQLKELMTWLFGSRTENKSPVVQTQNPDLGHLRKIISNKQALYGLRSGLTLQRSYEISQGDERRFQEALVRAKDSLQEAKATVTTGYKGEKDMLNVMDGILNLAKSISNEMTTKAKE
jgi:hypothetical protein